MWFSSDQCIKGILLDIYGVLYDGKSAIPGSVQAVQRLYDYGLPVRFCTNTSTKTQGSIAQHLQSMGFSVKPEHIFSPIPAVKRVVLSKGLRPYVILEEDAKEDFINVDQSDPNCVILGDAGNAFSYDALNGAFRVLLNSCNPILFSLGSGKYYSDIGGLRLDVGPYSKALEFATGVTPEIIGKPAKSFFMAPLADMGLNPENVVMIGDDIVGDVGGAQACGMKGVMVRTGKYRPSDEPHSAVIPDGYVDNLAHAVDLFLQERTSST